MAKTKRRDKSRVVLRTGESQRADGTYHYCWTDANRKRRYVYAKTLDELRYKEEQIEKDKKDGIKAEARYTTLNDMYELWKDLKRGLKNNTFENYKYMYETFVRQQIGSKTVAILTSILRKLRLANAKFRCWISSKKHSLWKRKDRSCLIFIAKLLWTDILILSFLTVLDSRNIRQPLTKQSVVSSVTAMMNSF